MAFQFKIQLNDITDPPVWRRLVVPEQFTFLRFHGVIQVAFGWGDYHLFQFSPKGWGSEPVIAVPNEEVDEMPDFDCKKIKLKDIFEKPKQKFTYIYDFGDDWEHSIILEKIIEEKITRAACIDGEGACPPEDCGGAGGYFYLKAKLSDPKHPEHKDMKEWLGLSKNQKWDPSLFDLESVKDAVKKV